MGGGSEGSGLAVDVDQRFVVRSTLVIWAEVRMWIEG